jgi:phytoene dehydrogenase-like protein
VTRDDGRADYDAVVIGSGPNGLVAAIEIATAGRSVLVVEAADRPGGGTRTEEVTLPGFRHDICSAIHPLAVGSAAMRDLPLERHGVRWIHPDHALAHPLDGPGSNFTAALLDRSIDDTAARLGADGEAWHRLMGTITRPGLDLVDALLDPISVPRHPVALARFGLSGIQGSERLGVRRFEGESARALFSGLAAHSILPLDALSTGGYGMMLGALGHVVGWPFPEGGAASIADALVAILRERGGVIECGRTVTSPDDLPSSRVALADTSPAGLVSILGDRLPGRYQRRVGRFRHGPGVFKVDWALDGPVPWTDPEVGRAGTVHVGGTAAQIGAAEAEVAAGRHPERPFVLVAQHSPFDPTRAPAGQHTLWGYCHVPNGSTVDMTARIEAQIERFAPGFTDRILARHTMDTVEVRAHGRNYVGGDINGGAADLRQFVFRPVVSLRPWRIPVPGWYLCSSSIPPGGGVHGMCGRKAARAALLHELRG